MPALRNLEAALTKGMDPLPKGFIHGRKCIDHKLCSFAQFLNLIWGPVINFIEALDNGAAPQWTDSLGFNANTILSEMVGVVPDRDNAMDMDMFRDFVCKIP